MNNKLVKLELLDFLRGTLAFLVMIYHFNLWNGNKNNFLNFIGIYGVESFFILSGVVLTYTYSKNKLDIFSYSMKGFLRDEVLNKRSQDLEKYYRLNGAIYICRTSKLLEEKSFILKEKFFSFIMDRKNSIDIDEEIDFKIVETFIKI